MKIYDCFTFSNEVDLLYMRVNELAPVVDEFVVVQGTTTFTGASRELVLPQSDPRLEPFSEKIRHVIIKDLPIAKSPWFAENSLRKAIGPALDGKAQPDDIILVSDVDEIPRRSSVERARGVEDGQIGRFELTMFYYGLNWAFPWPWHLGRVFRASALSYLTPQELRMCKADVSYADAGWHFSYFYRRDELVERITQKALAFADSEYATPEYLNRDYLLFCTRGGLGWCTTPKYSTKLIFHDVDESFPEAVKADWPAWQPYALAPENRDRWAESKARISHLSTRRRLMQARTLARRYSRRFAPPRS